MNNNKTLYKDFEEISLKELEMDYSNFPERVPLNGNKILMNDDDKITRIANHFKEIMETLGLDLKHDSLRDTPQRIARMYVKEIFSGLNPANEPLVTLFENKYQYNKMLVEKNITLFSYCEHHFVPIIGKVHVAYFSKGNVIGLSKINRLVQYYAKRPQVQERLTNQITEALKKAIGTEDVAVLIDAVHLCVASRGIEDTNSSTITADYSGKFINEGIKNEFLALVK